MTKPDSPKPMSAPAEWCDACKAERPSLMGAPGPWTVWPQRPIVCVRDVVCRTKTYKAREHAIAEWERATGRQWPEGTG